MLRSLGFVALIAAGGGVLVVLYRIRLALGPQDPLSSLFPGGVRLSPVWGVPAWELLLVYRAAIVALGVMGWALLKLIRLGLPWVALRAGLPRQGAPRRVCERCGTPAAPLQDVCLVCGGIRFRMAPEV